MTEVYIATILLAVTFLLLCWVVTEFQIYEVIGIYDNVTEIWWQLDRREAQYLHEISGRVPDCTAKPEVQKDLY